MFHSSETNIFQTKLKTGKKKKPKNQRKHLTEFPSNECRAWFLLSQKPNSLKNLLYLKERTPVWSPSSDGAFVKS